MKYFLSATFLLAHAVCTAQTGGIRGTVKTGDNKPAEYVDVVLKGTNMAVTTDKKGNYLIKNVAPGTYKVVVPVLGLKADETTVTVKDGEVAGADLVLTEDYKKLQEVVVTSNTGRYKSNVPSQSLRVNTPLLQMPQNIQVVTKEVLKDQQIISMSDGLVRNVSGLVRMEHWGDMYTNITARGAQVQAFRNGFNVVNSYWGPLTEDMSFVESIEFVKGPAGFMLSNGDPSGLYNVVTKKPTGVTKGEAGLTVGSFGLYRSTLDLDGKLSKDGKILYRLNAAAQNRGSFRPNEYNDRYALAPVVSFQVDDRTKLTLEYNYQRAVMSNVGSYYVFSPDGFGTLPVGATQLPGGTPSTVMNDHSMYATLQRDLGKGWKFTGQLARLVYNQEGYSMWPSVVNADGTMIRSISIWDARSNMTMGQFFVNGTAQTGSVTHKILGGLDLANKDYIADWSQTYNLDSAGAAFDPKKPNLSTPVMGYPVFDRSKPLEERAQLGGGLVDQMFSGLYLQDELGFFDNKVRLTLAGRYTDVKQSYYGGAPSTAQRLTPRVGVSVSLDKETSVYALYDQAFVPQTGILTSGEKVRPITGSNTEVGVKRDWYGGRWFTGLTAYRILKEHELVADPTQSPASGLSIELGQKLAQGIEFDLRGTLAPGLNLIANYAYTDSRVLKVADGVTALKEGDVVPGFSKHTTNAWLTYKLQRGVLKGAGISGGCTWLGDRATYWDPSPDPSKGLADYLKVDGGLFWENDRMKIAVNVFNVMNEYLYSGSYYVWLKAYNWQTEAPRNIRLSVNYRF
jgi:iron complex outermembrane receptor protein